MVYSTFINTFFSKK